MSKICRICREVVQNTKAKSLFEKDQNVLLLQIKLLTGESLNHAPGWPSYICKCCDDDLSIAVGFRKRCIQTQQQLRLESLIGDAEPEYLDPLRIVEKVNAQSDEESTTIESFEGASSDIESTLDTAQTSIKQNKILKRTVEEVIIQAQIESNDKEEYTNCQEAKKPKIAMKKKRPRIKWDLLTEEEAKQLLRERQLGDYVCDKCGKHFTSASNFKVHLQRHTGEKNFECKTCKKRFKTQQELRIHDTIHTGIKRYNCRFCDMAFKDCKSRIKHERRLHTLVRPFKCSHCDMTFVDGSQRGKHESVHSNVRNYHCELCDESFKKSFTLTQHKRSKKHKSKEESENNKQS